jgi:hypothetical protein
MNRWLQLTLRTQEAGGRNLEMHIIANVVGGEPTSKQIRRTDNAVRGKPASCSPELHGMCHEHNTQRLT